MGRRRMRVAKISLRARMLASAKVSPSGVRVMSPWATVANPSSSAGLGQAQQVVGTRS